MSVSQMQTFGICGVCFQSSDTGCLTLSPNQQRQITKWIVTIITYIAKGYCSQHKISINIPAVSTS